MEYYTIDELRDSSKSMDTISGIYFLWDNSSLVYVGQSSRGTSRVSDHKKDKIFDKYTWIPISVEHLNTVERFYIGKYDPKYNKICGDVTNKALRNLFNVSKKVTTELITSKSDDVRHKKRVVVKPVKHTTSHFSESQIEDIIRLRNKGYSYVKIGVELSISPPEIQSYLARSGAW